MPKENWSGARSPDLVVKAKFKKEGSDDYWARVGVGWKNDNGSMRLQLNPFVVLDSLTCTSIYVWPADQPADQPEDQR